jgi:ribonuclease P protein component
MRRAQRLRQRREFAAVYRYGRPYRSDLLILRALRTGHPLSRFGFTAGHRLGKVVLRNRLKRRLREAVRSLPVATGWDLILNARSGAAQADYQRLRAVVGELMARAGVLQDSEEVSAG